MNHLYILIHRFKFSQMKMTGCVVQNRNFLKIGIMSTFFKMIRISFNWNMLEKSNEMFNIYSKFFSVTFVLLPIFFLQNLQIKPNLSEIYFNIFISETTFYQIKPNLAGMDLGLCLVLIAIHLKIFRSILYQFCKWPRVHRV